MLSTVPSIAGKSTIKLNVILIGLLLACGTGIVSADQDIAGSSDHPTFKRMSGFHISDYDVAEHDSYEFAVSTEEGWEPIVVEGKKTAILYRRNDYAETLSSLQIVRAYQRAVNELGGKVLWESTESGNRAVTLMVSRGGKETWLEVWTASGNEYSLVIVERSAQAQDAGMTDMFGTLTKKGRVALYIYFEPGKFSIGPESMPIIEEIVEMMKDHADLKVSVEGHTDNVGDPIKNKALSEDRARAVVVALVKNGIDAKRLSVAGFGQERPIADNATEQGRAKNSRIELVKK